jgi:hypothetical protein
MHRPIEPAFHARLNTNTFRVCTDGLGAMRPRAPAKSSGSDASEFVYPIVKPMDYEGDDMHIQANPFAPSGSLYATPQVPNQWLQILPQQLQQLQQIAYVQLQQLQQIQQLIQLVPQQVQQQVQQLLQFVAQQQFGGAQAGLGAGIGHPQQSIGVPFQQLSPFTTPYATPSGPVM